MSLDTPEGRRRSTCIGLAKAAHRPQGASPRGRRAARRSAAYDDLHPHAGPHSQRPPQLQVVSGAVLAAWQPQVQPWPGHVPQAQAFELVGFDMVVI